MNTTFIRKESYGLLVFNPLENVFYQVQDKELENEILNINGQNTLSEKFSEEQLKLHIGEFPIKFIDNTRFSKEDFVPLEAYFDYTAKCNQNCKYCYNKEYLKNSTLSEETVRKILDDFYSLGIARVHLAGGEPTIDVNGLKNYIEYSEKLGLKVSLATNGTCLTDEVCEILTTNNLISVSISIDSADEKVNDAARSNGCYNRIMNGLKNLQKFKDKNHSLVKICFKPVYYPNISNEEIEKLIQLAIEKNIDIIKFANPERSIAHEKGYFSQVKEEYYQCAARINKIAEKYRDKIVITTITNPINFNFDIGIDFNKGCIGAQELITINPDGRITPCLMNHTLLGFYHDYKNLEEFILTSDSLKKYRKLINNAGCHGCNLYSSCRGGCQVRKIAEFGQIEKKDPLCPKDLCERKFTTDKKIKRVNVFHSL